MRFENEKQAYDFVMQTAKHFWHKAFQKHGAKIGEMPEIKLNKRLTATAGRACMRYPKNVANFPDMLEWIDYSYPILQIEENTLSFRDSVIPHELAHFVAWRVYGETNHGKMFYVAGHDMGVELTRCHTLKYAKRK